MSDIALLSTYAQVHVNHIHPNNQHIYIPCSFLQNIPDSFDRLYNASFPVLRQTSELALSVAAPTLSNTLPVSVKSAGNIITFRRQIKNTCLNSLILNNSAAYQSNCLQLKLIIDYKLPNALCFGALPS